MERTIADVLETLRHIKDKPEQCSLLIGSGCSVSADIPTADGIVEHVKNEYPIRYEKAEKKTYPHVMAQLLLDERREVIQHFVQKAKINWAHICIAQLIAAGYVDRVLTTNFDPLIMRACALLGEFPAVYDFGASTLFKPTSVAKKAIFHLHGQHSGFVTLHTTKECEEHGKRLGPLFDDAGRGRTWIVVGYSGDCDPVFEQLARVDRFTRGLYWVGYKDNEPSKDVREKLLQKSLEKDAFYIRKYTADSFFIKLTQELNIFPPHFIAKPFSHMDRCLNMLTEFPLGETEFKEDVITIPRKWIQDAIARHEITPDETETLESLMLEGKYEDVIKRIPPETKSISDKLKNGYAWSLVMAGNTLSDQAKQKSGEDADRLFKQACGKYAKAVEIKPDMHDALYNWGIALSKQARQKSGEKADRLFKQACEKYAKAVEIKPDDHEALYNWGTALSDQAKQKSGEERETLLNRAKDVCERAVQLNPAKTYNLGCCEALLGNEEGCRKALENAKKHGTLPSKEHIEKDSDLDSVRHTDWFKALLDE